jgi:hypothetical protein
MNDTTQANQANAKPMIYAAMAAVMSDISTVGKSGVNKEQHYKFRSIEDVMSAVRAGLIKHAVFYLPTVVTRIPETRQTGGGKPMNVVHLEIRYDFYAADGSSVSSVVWGEGADMADKATNKAMSQALKYNLVQAFSIAAEDMQDADRETVEAGPDRSYRSAAESFENATPRPSANGNGHAANGSTVRPEQRAAAPAPGGEPDADAQPYADEAHEARVMSELRAIHVRAREAHKLAALIRNPATNGIGGLGQYLNYRKSLLEKAGRALEGLKVAASVAGIGESETERRLTAACGHGIEEATAEEMEKAAEEILASAGTVTV